MNAHLNTLAATLAARTATLNALNALAQELCADLDTIASHVFDSVTTGTLVTVQLRSEDAVRAFAAERGLTVEVTDTDVAWGDIVLLRHTNTDIAVEGGRLRITACELVSRPAAEAGGTEAVA